MKNHAFILSVLRDNLLCNSQSLTCFNSTFIKFSVLIAGLVLIICKFHLLTLNLTYCFLFERQLLISSNGAPITPSIMACTALMILIILVAFLLLLDMSKAFDCMQYGILFNLLRCRNMCLVIRLIMNRYINQEMQIKWNSILSSSFPIANSINHGGVICHLYYLVYI